MCANLTSLPERIGDCKSLTKLDLTYCENLTSLPERFGELDKLGTLWMDKTPAGRNMPADLKAKLEGQGCKSKGNGW